MTDLIFWFIAAFTILSASLVVFNNQLLYSAVALLFTLFGVAGLYIFLWADFVAGIQLLVYIGGINVLIIFGIMLTNKIASVRLSQTNVQQGVGGVVSIWFCVMLFLVISKTPWNEVTPTEPIETVSSIGTLLLTKYLLPFEAISLLLLGALIGAALLSREGN